MGRQLFTLLLVFVGVMLLTRSCNTPQLPTYVPTVKAVEPEGDKRTELEAGGTRVVLARNGSLVSVTRDGAAIVRPVTPFQRPLNVVLMKRERKDDLLRRGEWRREAVDGGYAFVGTLDDVTVKKTVRVAADGSGLTMDLEIRGGDEDLTGLWVTAASGVRLAGPDAAPTGAVWRLQGRDARLRTFQEMVEAREHERAGHLRTLEEGNDPPRPLAHADQTTLSAVDRVDLFGLLGETGYLFVREAPPVSRLKLSVFRCKRPDDETSDEIEAWLELVTPGGEYTGTFRLDWGARADVARDLLGDDRGRAARQETLEDDTFRLVFSDRGACLVEAWLKPYSTDPEREPSEETWVPVMHRGAPQGKRALTLLDQDRTFGVNPATAVWTVTRPDPGSIRFELVSPTGWTLFKTVRLPEKGRYDLDVEIELARPDDLAAETVKYSVVGPSGVYIADADRGIIGADRPAGALLERSGGDDEAVIIDELADGETLYHQYGEQRRGLVRAIAVRGAYFVVALITQDREDGSGRLVGDVAGAQVTAIDLDREIERPDGTKSAGNMMGRLDFVVPVDAGRARSELKLYAGPNRLDDLRPVGIEDTVDFGFFGFIGRGLMWLMNLFQGLTGSYGVAIILMTLVVRGLLLPISYKTQLGMSRYQKRLAKVKPKLDEVEKKYKNNAQKLNQEKMRVMRENKVGFPLGCLTMLLQIPIWFALFQALRVEFAIRHQPFLWANDLSMPDRLFPLPFWPGWFNFLPILMLVLWVMQQKAAPTPQSDDPQMKMQMKMMKFMPFMFFIFLYKYAAALSVYMCVSSTWGIFESKYVRKAIATSD